MLNILKKKLAREEKATTVVSGKGNAGSWNIHPELKVPYPRHCGVS